MTAYTEPHHASACGIMFRPDARCTCAVGEVERLRSRVAVLEAGLDAIVVALAAVEVRP